MKDKLLKFLQLILLPMLLIGWCIAHYFVQQSYLFSPWYGGGFAMFSSLDKGDSTRAIRVWRKDRKGKMTKLRFKGNQAAINLLNLPTEPNGMAFLESQNYRRDKTYFIEVFQFNYSSRSRKLVPQTLRRLRLKYE